MLTVVSQRARRRILVVDDEPSIVDAVATALRYEGFEVFTAETGRQALDRVHLAAIDLVVLDIMLPDLDGLEVCRRMRLDGITAPVLFLTARTGAEQRVAGLNAGGDDYVEKPFSLAEIIARIEAILRRTTDATEGEVLRYADLTMDVDGHRVTRAGGPVALTATEFRLLRYLLANATRVLSKAQILDQVWHYDFDGDPNVVETYVSYLRRKLDEHGPPLIHTVRLVGYVLRREDR